MKITEFDHRKYFEENCRPLLKELMYHCNLQNMPCFFSFCVDSKKDSTEYVVDGVMTGSREINLYDDKINRHMLIQSGFEVSADAQNLEVPEDYLSADF